MITRKLRHDSLAIHSQHNCMRRLCALCLAIGFLERFSPNHFVCVYFYFRFFSVSVPQGVTGPPGKNGFPVFIVFFVNLSPFISPPFLSLLHSPFLILPFSISFSIKAIHLCPHFPAHSEWHPVQSFKYRLKTDLSTTMVWSSVVHSMVLITQSENKPLWFYGMHATFTLSINALQQCLRFGVECRLCARARVCLRVFDTGE